MQENSNVSEKLDLYPVPEAPRLEKYLQVDDTHQLYICEYGNPQGIPAVFCHGGPGSRSKPKHAGYFNPDKYRIILFDQRGAGNSKPAGSLKDNNTHQLINDMEKIRQALQIDKWVILGGSWGSTLALLYAESYPQHVSGLALRGIFLARPQDCEIFYKENTPAALCHPQAWQTFKNNLATLSTRQNKSVNNDLITNLLNLLTDKDKVTQQAAADILGEWEKTIAFLNPPPEDNNNNTTLPDPDALIQSAIIEVTYTKENCYLKENQILANTHPLTNIPVHIIQGNLDLMCPQYQAYELFENLQTAGCDVQYHECIAGHAGEEPALINPTVRAMDDLLTQIGTE
jgi:proline iminopeptidase